MNDDFVAEILRATGSLRSGDPAGATAIIRAALAAGGLAPSSPHAPNRSLPLPESDAGLPRARPRRPLGEVIRTLAAGRRRLALDGGMRPPAKPAPDLPLPAGAEFRDLRFACPAGERRYRLYVPAAADEGPRGLIVMLHGCTQTPEDFAAGTGMNRLAEEHRLLVAYPGQTGTDNAMSCWNWFRPQDQMRGAGEPSIIAGITQAIRDEFAVPDDRVFVAGLSAGGAMAAIVAEAYPDVFAGVGIHSGLACGSANDVVSAFGAMRGEAAVGSRLSQRSDARTGPAPRMIVFHGGADSTVHPINAERIVADRSGKASATRRSEHAATNGGRPYTRLVAEREDGTPELECWIVEGAGHAWLGGHPSGTYTDPRGPDASAEMVRFFLSGSSPTGRADRR